MVEGRREGSPKEKLTSNKTHKPQANKSGAQEGSPFASMLHIPDRNQGKFATQEGEQKRIDRIYYPFKAMDHFNHNFPGIWDMPLKYVSEEDRDKVYTVTGDYGQTYETTHQQQDMIYKVKLAYGVIAHKFLTGEKNSFGESIDLKQKLIELKIEADRQKFGNDHVTLNAQERDMLVRFARLAGIPFDRTKTEYSYDAIPRNEYVRKNYESGYLKRPFLRRVELGEFNEKGELNKKQAP